MNGIIAKKLGMTQIFTESGECIPVTVLEAGPCVVVRHLTAERDGYSAIQLGFGDVKAHRVNKPDAGQFAKAGIAAKEMVKEFDCENPEEFPIGSEVRLDILSDSKSVQVSGTSKGRGFAGTIRRHGFTSGPRSHGSKNVREPGSIGACSYPSRVWPGKKMPGQYGNKKVTVRNIEIVKIDNDNNLLYLKGAVPGHKNSIIMVKKG
jgi:large subunit ribosomal protein L3